MNRVGAAIKLNAAHKKAVFGEGISVAILDTGIHPHPDFNNRVIVFKDFLHERKEMYDDCGHGTHVAYLIIIKEITKNLKIL